MEGKKRKSDLNGDVLRGSYNGAREDDNGEETTVTEEEVEEFFAILRRIHVAVNYFKKGNGDIRNLTELGTMESLNSGGNFNLNENGGKKEEENVGLDLNADPDTGSDPF
ncbi:hypothetical protein CRYUN_Cryun06bG0175800 [Craigia yunnanensis]